MYYDAKSLSGGGHACTCDVDPKCCDPSGGLSAFGLGQAMTKAQTGTLSVVGLGLSLLILSKIFERP